MKTKIKLLILLLLSGCCAVQIALGKELLDGKVKISAAEVYDFALSGESRKDVVGGEIKFGEKLFKIEKLSRLGLIGASLIQYSKQDQSFEFAEIAIFSSSFSEQTAVGQPWVASKRTLNCDSDYNSFLVVYRIDSEAKLKKLGETPYPLLTDDVAQSDDSTVYCFMSRPPA